MNKIIFLFLILSTSSHAQLNIIGPIEYTGFTESIRTVHFTDDCTKILGDWDTLVEWDIASQSILKRTEIPGYSTYKSSFDGASFWVNGNSNYNTEAKDVTDMHNNFNSADSSGMKAHKTERPYGVSAIVKGTKEVVILASTKKYTYQVVRLNTETMKESTIYFDENRDGASVPTAIKLSEDGTYLGISMAGEKSGLRIYNLESGKLLHTHKSSADANDLAFSGDGRFVFINNGAALVQLATSDWREVKIWDLKETISSLDVNSEGTYAVLAFEKKGAVLMNLQNGAMEATLSSVKIADVTFSNDDQFIGLGIHKTLKSASSPSILLYQVVK